MTSKQEKKVLFTNFNKEYFELLDYMKEQLKDNKEYKSFYRKNKLLKKTNIKLIIKTWHTSITLIYKEPIMKKDIDFFLNNDYSEQIEENKEFSSCYSVVYYINELKNMYETISNDCIDIVMNKIHNLTKITDLYYK